MMVGYQLQLNIAASFEFIHIIQGKPSLSPKGALAIILRSGLLGKLDIQEDNTKATVIMQRKDNGFTYTSSWSIDDARKADLVKPSSPWIKYPKNMCRWRAIGYCCDVLFPDVLSGLVRADDLGAVIDTKGDVISGEYREIKSFNEQLSAAINTWGVDAILLANEGKIPSSEIELDNVVEDLSNAKIHKANEG